jgi:hypothetical protein
MIWWFLILGVSTLVVVCVAIAVFMRLRRHLQAAHAAQGAEPGIIRIEPSSSDVEP